MFPRIPSTFHFCWHHRNLGGFPDGLDGKEVCLQWKSPRVGSLDWKNPLEKGMATHSGILAWRMLWTEEPDRATVNGVSRSRTWLKD